MQAPCLSLSIACVTIAIALGALPYTFISDMSNAQAATLQSSQGSALQSEVQDNGSFPVVNQPPQTRRIIVEWGMLASEQDRFFPQVITANQGDTINLLVESNDTDGAHTFTIDAPTGANGEVQMTQLNVTVPGQWMYYPPLQAGPQFGVQAVGKATDCYTMAQSVPCNTVGGCSINGGALTDCIGSWMLTKNQTETASVQASATFGPLRAPGIYEYTCVYHANIGMVGYLVVLPNKGYQPAAT